MKKTVVLTLALAVTFALAGVASADDQGGWYGYGYPEAGNFFTGPNSNNQVKIESEDELEVEVENDAEINIKAENEADTGDNKINGNVMSGTIGLVTGHAAAAQAIDLIVNLTDLQVAKYKDCGCEAPYAVNGETGRNSNNQAKIELEDETEVEVENDADVDVDVENESETGDNEINENGGYETWTLDEWKLDKAELATKHDSRFSRHGSLDTTYAFSKWESDRHETDTKPADLDIVEATGDAQSAQSIGAVINSTVKRVLVGGSN